MKRVISYFLQGLIFLVPIALTFWLVGGAVFTVDAYTRDWLGITFPGVGLLLLLLLITGVGFIASNFFLRQLLDVVERVVDRIPIIRPVRAALKDVMSAFVGPERRFERPAIVELQPQGRVLALGFITREALDSNHLTDMVAVYFPQSYNFAGQVVLVPRAAVRPLDVPPGDVMTFIVSGGISGRCT